MMLFLIITSIVLIISLCIGLIRIFRGPTLEDRIMSVQLMGTTGVGILLILGLFGAFSIISAFFLIREWWS